MTAFKTLKAAREAGFCEREDYHYGGEEIIVKGHLLVRNAKAAVSRTEWSKRGFRVGRDAIPHARCSVYSMNLGHLIYDVYREDQVEPKRRAAPPKQIDILAAVWVINRRAKRCRDLASTHYATGTHGLTAAVKQEKLELYRMKGQALHYLHSEGRLTIVGYHRFPGGNWAEVLHGSAYVFHRPCPAQASGTAAEIEEIEAKPRRSKEPRLKDARHTVEEYLRDRPEVEVFEWPQKALILSTREWEYREDNDSFSGYDDFDDDDFEDDL
jgi:hypothetical protein